MSSVQRHEERARVLIVDDDEAMRLLIGAALAEEDFELWEAESGKEALEMCQSVEPHLILLDVMMPGMNGYETCQAIRGGSSDAETLILMVTGLDEPESIELAYDAGATDFIAKPINCVMLKHRVRYVLRAYRDRKAAEARIARLAFYDELTGLPNRAFLRRHLAYVVEQTKRRGRSGAVLSLDLDGFKRVNDSLGHVSGDALLRSVAGRLQQSLRSGDCVSRVQEFDGDALVRLGGDEFIVVVSDLANSEDAVPVAARILDAFTKPFTLLGQDFHLTTSVGIASYPSSEDSAELLLRNADVAMYQAKRAGGGCYQFYCEEMSRKARDLIQLENSMRHGIEREEFELYYQPKVRDITREVVGVEALIRWPRPGHGLVAPLDFIPLAEHSGLIVPLGAWVIRTACKQAVAWSREGLPDLSVAVNISARQFRDRELARVVRAALQESGLAPERLELEVTEGTLMEDIKLATSVLSELRAIGVSVAIDDFGTGYSSLNYLKCLPVDTLKVDRCFVRDIATNQDSAAIVAAILAMAHSLRLHVVAEGVETWEQFEFLINHGCSEVQGFLFSKPLPAREFAEWLSSRLQASMRRLSDPVRLSVIPASVAS